MASGESKPTDEQLMAAYVAGDEGAFAVLFQRFGKQLFRFARRRLRNDEEASDVLQQTMLHMHRSRHDFRPGSHLRPWLFTIARNLVREHYRRLKRKPLLPITADTPEPRVEAPTPIEDSERIARVRQALASLPDNQREVIELHWFDESPYDEIALIMGASVAAVRVRAHRGYNRLRLLLRDEMIP